jgi:hypothetical protein
MLNLSGNLSLTFAIAVQHVYFLLLTFQQCAGAAQGRERMWTTVKQMLWYLLMTSRLEAASLKT